MKIDIELSYNYIESFTIIIRSNSMNIIFLGPPGAGKGTVAAIVKEQLGLVHISTGDLFRSNIKNETVL